MRNRERGTEKRREEDGEREAGRERKRQKRGRQIARRWRAESLMTGVQK